MKASLEKVAPNLLRDPASLAYYGDKVVSGKRYRKSLHTADRRTANKELALWIASLQQGDTRASDLKLDALIGIFLESRGSKKAKTRGTEENIAKKLRETFLPGMGISIGKLRTSDLLTWLNTEARVRSWRNVTFNRQRLFLKQVFDLAVGDGLLSDSENPFKARLIRPRRKEKVMRNIPTLRQFEAIVANVRAIRDNPEREQSANFLEFLGSAGVGQAEASALTFRDITGERINFVRQKTGVEFTIPIYAWLRPLISRLLANRRSVGDHCRVFSINDAGSSLTAACARLGLPRFTQRNLRAMLIKRLYDAGVPVKRIALWQGHSDGGKLIQEIYTEVFCDTDAAAEAADLARVTTDPTQVLA